MTDTVKSWIEERRVRRNVLGHQGLIFVPDEDGNATLWHDGERVGARDEGVRSLVDAHNNLPRALDALSKVIELHAPMSVVTSFVPVCAECEEIGGGDVAWPCPTVQAIEGAINE